MAADIFVLADLLTKIMDTDYTKSVVVDKARKDMIKAVIEEMVNDDDTEAVFYETILIQKVNSGIADIPIYVVDNVKICNTGWSLEQRSLRNIINSYEDPVEECDAAALSKCVFCIPIEEDIRKAGFIVLRDPIREMMHNTMSRFDENICTEKDKLDSQQLFFSDYQYQVFSNLAHDLFQAILNIVSHVSYPAIYDSLSSRVAFRFTHKQDDGKDIILEDYSIVWMENILTFASIYEYMKWRMKDGIYTDEAKIKISARRLLAELIYKERYEDFLITFEDGPIDDDYVKKLTDIVFKLVELIIECNESKDLLVYKLLKYQALQRAL